MRKSGQVLYAAELDIEYGFADIDGRQPASLRGTEAVNGTPSTQYATTLVA